MKYNQIKAGAVLSYISMGLGSIISLIYTPIMLRLLGQSEYGLYNLASSVVGYLGLFDFGFGSAYIRYYSRYRVAHDHANIAKLNGMFFIVYSFIGIIAFLAGLVIVLNIEFVLGNKITGGELTTAKILIAIMVFNLLISFPTSIFNLHITANERFIFQRILGIARYVINPFLMLPVLLMGYGTVGMVVVTTVITFLVATCNILFCMKKLKMKITFRYLDFSVLKEITVFSSYILLNMIINKINWNVDKFILGRMRGTVVVAIYSIAAQLNTYYLSVSTAVSTVFIPRINRMVATYDSNKQLTDLFTRVGRIQFIILSLVCSALIFFGRPFIALWAGSEYSDAYPIALLLIVPVTIPLIQNLGIEIQKAKNMHQFRSWTYLFIAVVNVLVSIPLAKRYGGMGAALGTALSLVVGNVLIMNWYYHKRIGLNLKFFWKQILIFIPALILPAITGIVCTLFDLYDIMTFVLCGFIYIIVFCISMWFLGLNAYEKELVTHAVSRVTNRNRK